MFSKWTVSGQMSGMKGWLCHIYLYIERATRPFFFLPHGGYPSQIGSLIDRPAKKSGPSFIGLRAGGAGHTKSRATL